MSSTETHQARVGELFTLSSQGFNLRAICCYLGNVLHTLHGHICTSALTSLLFLAPARHWRLLWWCHAGFQNRSDCLSWVTLPVFFSCPVCLRLFICQTARLVLQGLVWPVLCLAFNCAVFSKQSFLFSFFLCFFQIRSPLLMLILCKILSRLPKKLRLNGQLNIQGNTPICFAGGR